MDYIYDFLNLIDPDIIKGWAEQTLSHQFTQMTLAFLLASWLHSGRVKKEIKTAFETLVVSIDNVATKVTNEMAGIRTEIKKLGDRVDHLEKRVMGDQK